MVIGGVALLLTALLQGGERPQRPTKRWSMLGGIIMAPTFVTTPAAGFLGTQLTLMLLLIGMVTAALFFDFLGGKLAVSKTKSAGLALFVVGIGLEVVDAIP